MLKQNGSLLMVGFLLLLSSSCRLGSRAAPPPALNNESVPSLISQADQFYAHRDDLKQLEQGIVLLRQAAANDPNSYEANWRLAKFNYYLARHTDGEYRERALREGATAGKTAVTLQPNQPDGHFWLGANFGGSLESETLSALASIEDVRKEMDAVLSLNPGYQDGSAYMVLGLLDLKAPKIAGGDPQRAVTELEKGLQFGKGNAFLRLHLAEAYEANGRAEDARQQLNAIVSMTPDPNYLPELKEAQAQARPMLDKIK